MVDTANNIWRNYEIDGLPSSEEHEPEKVDIRVWGTDKEERITAAEADIDALEAADTAIDTRLSSLEGLAIEGLQPRETVACATTANITLSGEQTLDTVLTSASRVLVKDQSTSAQNGIYVSGAGAWTRATDNDTAAEVTNSVCYVAGGSANIDKAFFCESTITTLGTDDSVWSQWNVVPDFTAAKAKTDEIFNGGGINNIGLGTTAISSVTSGTKNTAMGDFAGRDLTSGGENVFLGYLTTYKGTGSTQNTIVGSQALYNTTGSPANNSAFGYKAASLYTGNEVSAFGSNALASLTSGVGQTAFGTTAGFGTTTGQGGTSVGFSATCLNYEFSIAVGYNAQVDADYQIKLGTGTQTHAKMFGRSWMRWDASAYNMYFGSTGPATVPTGAYNLGIGEAAVAAATSGANNLGIGKGALEAQTTGSNNLAFGVACAQFGITLADCTYIGVKTARYTTTGTGGTGVGFRSLEKSKVALNNTAIGDSSLWVMQGGQNVAGGYTVAEAMAAGSRNIIFGMSAMRYRHNGDDNVNIGHLSGAITSNSGTVLLTEVTAPREPAEFATTANITLSGEQTIDGTLTSASRVFVKDQTDATENGIYVSGAGAWTRATDSDSASELQLSWAYVSDGTANAGKTFKTTVASITLGVTDIDYVEGAPTLGAFAGDRNVGIGTRTNEELLGSDVTSVGHNAGRSMEGSAAVSYNSTFLGALSGYHGSQKADADNSMALGANTYTDKDNQVVIGDSNVAETVVRGVTRHTTYSVAGLPSASSMGAGARAFVTDATATTFASIVAGSGANGVPVYSDGTNWRIG